MSDFLEENWWILALLVIVWEYTTRGTMRSAASVAINPVVVSTNSGLLNGTSTSTPIRGGPVLPPAGSVTALAQGGGAGSKNPRKTTVPVLYAPTTDSVWGTQSEDEFWGDNG